RTGLLFSHSPSQASAWVMPHVPYVPARAGSRASAQRQIKVRSAESLCHLRCEIGQDQVGTGAFYCDQHFHYGAFFVEPAVDSRGSNHGVLARHIVRGDRYIEFVLGPINQVEIGQGGFYHYDVRALIEVQRDLSHRLVTIWRIHLVRTPIAELWRR